MVMSVMVYALQVDANGQVSAPVLAPAEGESFAKFSLKMTCSTPGAEIHYTTNGKDPISSDPWIASGATITIDKNLIIKAKATISGGMESVTTTGVYTLTGDLAAGGSHSLGMTSGGAIKAWGLQTDGRLGNNLTIAANISTPTLSKYTSATAISDALGVAGGVTHSVFLKTNRTVWTFGQNTTGALGNNTTTNSGLAVQVQKSTTASDKLIDCVAVAAGSGFSGALTSTGKVYTWGSRVNGRLSDTTTVTGNKLFAGLVKRGDGADLVGINRIAFGTASGMAKEASALELDGALGQVWTWGSNTSGQLGQGNVTDVPRALRVKLNATDYLTDAYDISSGENHSAVVRWNASDPELQGSVMCFGQQQYGRLGNNATAALAVSYPVKVFKSDGSLLTGIVSVAAGSAHTLALDLDGYVWAWGYGANGALGTNSITSKLTAVKVRNPANTADLSGIVRIAAGGTGLLNHSLAVASNGTVYAWGYNINGQLGNATTTTKLLPVVVTGSLDLLLPNPPTVSMACSVTPGSYPQSVTLTANPADVDNNLTKVEFFVQGSMVGQLTAAPWSLNLNSLASGSYQVYAVATDATPLTGYSTASTFQIFNDPLAESLDADGDGLIDATELALGLDPNDADTDGDGIPDGQDANPLVPDVILSTKAATIMVWAPME